MLVLPYVNLIPKALWEIFGEIRIQVSRCQVNTDTGERKENTKENTSDTEYKIGVR
jgi:hypothetical protein